MEQILQNPNALYWILFIGTAVASWIVSASVEAKFKRYSKTEIPFTGKDIAEKMLRDNGIYDVRVTCTEGHLTDHYNPTDKTVNLSSSVYGSASVAAAAIAAHECGHAVQHAAEYAPLQMRSALVPVVSFASKWVMWIILAGMILINIFPHLLLIGIILFALTTLFSFITLPVEIDASRRAVDWLETAERRHLWRHPHSVVPHIHTLWQRCRHLQRLSITY